MSSLMQGQGGTIDSFPEIVNIDEGTSPNDTSIGQPNSLHNMLNPTETRLSNYTVPSGEPTSRLGHQNQVMQDALNHRLNGDDVSKMERGSSSSYDARIWTAPRSEEMRIGPPDVFLTGRLDNRRSGSICLQRSSSNFDESGGLERGQISNASVSYDNVGSSSGSTNHVGSENNNGSGSLSGWGLSFKRKSVEETSGQSAGASSCFQQIENVAWRSGNDCNEASSSLCLSTPSSRFLNVTPPDQSNPRNQQESSPFSVSSTRAAEYSSFFSTSHPRVASFDDTVDLRNVHPIPWTGTSDSGVGNPSSSINSGERAVVLREEPNVRSIPRNTAEGPVFVPATEMRNVSQDHWSVFPPIGTDSGGRSVRSPLPSSSPSSSARETVVPSQSNSSQGNNQPYPRLALITERHGDDVLGMSNSVRALASDIEGRHRLISEICQVLYAVSRGENLRIEDHTAFDPFTYHGMSEMHDRHRDMRLDVDNMSYEDLLALEERIGDVSTGLSEETILKRMKQRKHSSASMESPQDLEPCCVCQEVYVDGDDTGMLDCGHDFHTSCIKQWLLLKNMCPICKTTGLRK